MEYNTVLSETSLLDPRFKRLGFNNNIQWQLCFVATSALRKTILKHRADNNRQEVSHQPIQTEASDFLECQSTLKAYTTLKF